MLFHKNEVIYVLDEKPLAFRMRPTNIEEVIGQKHILGKDKLLYRLIKTNRLSSIILFGPPGTGKTSIANAIAMTTNLPFESINAVSSGKKDMEKVIKKTEEQGKTILFVDEIHRFNKSQQDYLLPFLEKGVIILIGATTENPYFEILPSIRSRSQIFELKPLELDDIKIALKRALMDKEMGLGSYYTEVSEEALIHLAENCGGDIRSALGGLELSVLSTEPNEEGIIVVDLATAEQSIQKKSFSMDKGGDSFYNLLSALQKSIRGSDVDAALHYLARSIEGFGDLKTICRRLSIIVFEDISLADPSVWSAVMSSIECVERVGMPEARIPLANAVVLMCLSPKSNTAYSAFDRAWADVKSGLVGDVPSHLKDAHYSSSKKLGRGVGYKYPHDYPTGWVNQQYLPNELAGKRYYVSKEVGYEKKLGLTYHKLNELKKPT